MKGWAKTHRWSVYFVGMGFIYITTMVLVDDPRKWGIGVLAGLFVGNLRWWAIKGDSDAQS